MADLLDQPGKHKCRCDGVATAHFAEPLILVGFHRRRVVASLCHADGGTHTVSGSCLQKIFEAIEAFEIAKRHQLYSLVGKNNGGHLFLLTTGTRTIQVPDSEAELLRALSAQLQNALRLATGPRIRLRQERPMSGRNNASERRVGVDVRLCQIGKHWDRAFGATEKKVMNKPVNALRSCSAARQMLSRLM